jgi:hypothetical protein
MGFSSRRCPGDRGRSSARRGKHGAGTGEEAETGGKEKGITPVTLDRSSTGETHRATGLLGEGFLRQCKGRKWCAASDFVPVTAKAIGSIIVLVAIVALSGLVVAYYIKRRIANVATSTASVTDEIFTLIGVCLYLFVSSVAFTAVFLGSFDDISSDYLLGLGVSGLHFFLVGGVAIYLGKNAIQSEA